jgi:predicted alpha/beta-fold hydrolase
MTKYLGEEGLAGTLPPCVKGAISLGNPLTINSGKMKFVPSFALNLGVRKQMLLGWKQFRQMTSLSYQSAYRRALLSNTIGESDHITAPHMIRNETTWPFETKIGYESGNEYWDDASSYRYISHISVPLLQITAQDDFLVYNHSLSKLSHCLSNPNVMVVKTKCGGHLGWHEAPPDTGNVFGFGTSWADTATADFIDSVLKLNTSSDGFQKHPSNNHPPNEHDAQNSGNASNGLSSHADPPIPSEVKEKAALLQQAVSDGSHIRSRL